MSFSSLIGRAIFSQKDSAKLVKAHFEGLGTMNSRCFGSICQGIAGGGGEQDENPKMPTKIKNKDVFIEL
jgi:hypothetical protein